MYDAYLVLKNHTPNLLDIVSKFNPMVQLNWKEGTLKERRKKKNKNIFHDLGRFSEKSKNIFGVLTVKEDKLPYIWSQKLSLYPSLALALSIKYFITG